MIMLLNLQSRTTVIQVLDRSDEMDRHQELSETFYMLVFTSFFQYTQLLF